MKSIKKLLIVLCALPIFAVTLIAALFVGGDNSRAYAYTSYNPYEFEFTGYDVTYDIRTDRTMDVTLDLDVHYIGYSCTGILFDIPVNAGDRVRHVKAYELNGDDGKEGHLDYDVKNEESRLITVDMGDTTNKTGSTHYYRVKYEYAITKPAKNEKDTIFLNAIGYGSYGAISNVNIKLNMPNGFKPAATKCYSGSRGGNDENNDFVIHNNTVNLHIDRLDEFIGVTFELGFDEGVLTVKTDFTPYWVIIAACVLLAVLFAVKFLLFNKDGLTPVVNIEAPDDMDPLVMGKLIDNKVNNSDVTSLIYYWANKGYLKINMEDENDVELIRIIQQLPMGSPKYQTMMYDKLFASGDVVKIKSLANTFYPTVKAVVKSVNAENGKLYDGKSMGAAVLFALIGALFMGLTPIAMGLFTISFKLFNVLPLFMIVPAFVVFALSQTVLYNRLKLKKGTIALMYLGIALLSVVFTLIYAAVVPSYLIEFVPKVILGIAGFGIVILSSLLMNRTKEYNEKLNKIVGFREFILHAEKDKLEALLERNPEFYYHVLPYAIVLGVSDIWEEKFAELTVPPPGWMTNHNAVFNIVVFNATMRNVNSRMATSFVSRPSSGSYSGGGHHGGSFGGFSGGGHGGGGFRGR